MGQRIAVEEPILLGDIALFVTDRSFASVEGARFESPADAEAGQGVAADLAAHLYEREGGVRHIYISANSLAVNRVLAWNETHLASVKRAIEDFLLFYPDN